MNVKINNKTYTVPELTFRHFTKMEEQGISVIDVFQKRQIFLMSMAYTCVVANVEREEAERLIEQHVMGGGTLNSIFESFVKAASESDFFQHALGLDEEKKTAKKSE